MEILASTSPHQHCHWHQHCKKNIFTFRILRSEYLCSFLCLVGISTTLLHILISLRFPVHPFRAVYSCSRKRLFEHSETSLHWCFKETTVPKISAYFAYFLANIQGGVLFKYTCRPSWDCAKKFFGAAILQTGICPSNLDVRYSVQKTQSFFQVSFETQS